MEYGFGTDPHLSWSPQTVTVDDDGWADYTTIKEALADNTGPISIIVRPK